MKAPSLSPDAVRALEVVRQRAMDGYSLQSMTALEPDSLFKAIRELQEQDLVLVKGPLSPDSIGKVFVSVVPSSLGLADYLIRR